ncbi:unnamed protein product, partial [Prorocentrum cordatum]
GRGRLLWGPLVSSSARLRKPAAESPRGGAAPGRPEPAGATRRERPLESSRAGLPWSLGGARHRWARLVHLHPRRVRWTVRVTLTSGRTGIPGVGNLHRHPRVVKGHAIEQSVVPARRPRRRAQS